MRLAGDGTDGIYDRVEYQYNRLGHAIWTKDQNETVHEYAFDGLGRQTADRVTLPQGSEIDDSVLRIEHGYEVRGMVASITSFDATTGGNAVNQVLREYDDWGLLDKEYQEHAGEVDANSLYVQYNYADASAGLRLESVRYPNGRLVHYTYGSAGSDADHLNRLDAIRDDDGGNPGDVLAQYTYLGLGTVVVEDYVQPQVKLDLWGGTSGEYQGFDRFGRIVDQLWRDYGASADADRFLYGYDRAGNRIWKENDVAANLGTPLHLDELYEYDELYRLINTQRGNLSANHDAITDKAFEQDWGLDATGNWEGFNQDLDGDGTNDLEQTREHNEANEVTSAGGWASPAHDRVGNMTSMPKPASPADALGAKYDAWNRLVEVSEGGILIARFSYDGAGRRILKQLADAQEPDQYIHFFHSGQQVVETREGDDSAGVPDPTQLPPRHQFVWSPRYVDSLILRDDYDAQGQLVDGERLFYLADANFNVTALVGLVETEPDVFEWQVVEHYVYSPYGAVTIYAPDWSATRAESAFDNTTLYTGREFDSETGLYYYRARYCHAELGQFVSRDPISYWGGINLYEYVGDSPMARTDPNGLGPIWPNGTPVGGTIRVPFPVAAPPSYGCGSPGPIPDFEQSIELITSVVPAGPCHIKLWMGDTRDNKGGPAGLNDFYNANCGTDGVYIGVVGCGAYGPGGTMDNSLPPIPPGQQIPGFPACGGPSGLLAYADAADAVEKAVDAAEALVKQLCKGKECKSVTLSVQYTPHFAHVLGQTPAGREQLQRINSLLRRPKKTSCCPQSPER